VVHVIEETLHPAIYNAGAYSIYDLQPDIEAKALEFLETSYRAAPGPEVPVTFEVLTGHAASEVVRLTAERNIGMLVMATHGLTGLAHMLLGSVTERVVRTAACPVFTLKSFGREVISTRASDRGRTQAH
jgi:nucleotide-binding universal stress UspA family protein